MFLRAVVVGSGIAGLCSALCLQRKGYQVELIDTAPEPGGLLRSWLSPEGFSFDYGTHFLRETGNSELDHLIFPEDMSDWSCLPKLRPGHYNQGMLNTQSSNINAQALPSQLMYLQAIEELLNYSAQPISETAPLSLYDELKSLYGPILVEHLFEPVVKKFLDTPSSQLAPGVQHLFGLSRVVLTSCEVTNMLKQLPQLDSRLAYHSAQIGVSNLKSYYPRHQGIGLWVDTLIHRFKKAGGTLHLNTSVVRAHVKQKKIMAIETNNRILECDHVSWTAPFFLFAKTANITLFHLNKVNFRQTTLVHLVLDQPFSCDNHYLAVMDQELKAFRITLYSNIENTVQDKPNYRCTLEFLHGSEGIGENPIQKALTELKQMEIITESTKVRHGYVRNLGQTFPIITPEFLSQSKSALEYLRESFENVVFCGRGTGGSFLMYDILKEAFEQHQEL